MAKGDRGSGRSGGDFNHSLIDRDTHRGGRSVVVRSVRWGEGHTLARGSGAWRGGWIGEGEGSGNRGRATAEGGVGEGLAKGDRGSGRSGGDGWRRLVDRHVHRGGRGVVVRGVRWSECHILARGSSVGRGGWIGEGEGSWDRSRATTESRVGEGLAKRDHGSGRDFGDINLSLVDRHVHRGGCGVVVRGVRRGEGHTLARGSGIWCCSRRSEGEGSGNRGRATTDGRVGEGLAKGDRGSGRSGDSWRCLIHRA